MIIEELIEQLSIFPSDLEVHVRTVPDDFSQPLRLKNLSLCETLDTRGGETKRERPIVIITAYFPEKNV